MRRYNGARVNRPCRHCGRVMYLRCRSLCWRCWDDDGVKALYPSANKWFGVCPSNPSGRSPDSPTVHPPGTEDKMAVMSERIAAGRSPFHPADAQYDGDVRPLLYAEAEAGSVRRI